MCVYVAAVSVELTSVPCHVDILAGACVLVHIVPAAIALLSGNESAKLAFSAFTDGIWAVVFWVGAVGIGFGIPLIASLIAGKNTESKVSFYFAGTCAIAGMMCLRLFILYAGQMNTIV